MPRHLPPDLIDEVRERIDIVEVISRYVRLARSGRRYRGLCPFHQEKTPSFYVDPEKQLFHCFGCRAGGNVFNFLMKIEHAPFVDVVRQLADSVGLSVESSAPSPEEERRRREAEELRKVVAEAARFYAQLLFAREGAPARRYLKGRGLDGRIARVFGIGFAPADWHRLHQHLLARGISEEVALRAGLLGRGERGVYDWLRNRIVFPIVDVRGRVVGFGGRLIDGDGPKYLNSSESPIFSKRRQLYGLHLAKEEAAKSGRIVVVEGYMDVVGLYRHGFRAAVATLGTAFAREQALLLKRYVKEVVLAYDADGAGRTATLRGLDILAAEGLEVRVARLPEGHDPDSLVAEEGLDAFLRVLDASLSLVEYKIEEALSGADLETIEGRVKASERLLPILAAIENPVGREGYVRAVAARLGVSVSSLQEALEAHRVRRQAEGPTPSRGERPYSIERHNLSRGRYTIRDLPGDSVRGKARVRPQGAIRAKTGAWSERDLLLCLLEEPDKASWVKTALGEAPFSLDAYNKLFHWLMAQGESGVTGESLLGRIDDPQLAQTVGALLVHGERPPGPFEVYLDRFKEFALRRQVSEIRSQLEQLMLEEQPDLHEVGRLVVLYKELRERMGVSADVF